MLLLSWLSRCSRRRARGDFIEPLMLMVTNRIPTLIDLFKRPAENYGISMVDLVYPDPAAGEAAVHPSQLSLIINQDLAQASDARG